jgi:hypothetical protein
MSTEDLSGMRYEPLCPPHQGSRGRSGGSPAQRFKGGANRTAAPKWRRQGADLGVSQGDRDKRRARMRCPSPMMASALRRLVGEIENARAEGLRVHELQRLLIDPVLKQTLSTPHDDGMEHEPKFVEEAVLQQ